MGGEGRGERGERERGTWEAVEEPGHGGEGGGGGEGEAAADRGRRQEQGWGQRQGQGQRQEAGGRRQGAGIGVKILLLSPPSFPFLFFLFQGQRRVSFGFWRGASMLAAVERGDAQELAALMQQDPGFKVNSGMDMHGNTLLHRACLGSHCSPVIPLLLAHPEVDVNVKNRYGFAPFFGACEYGTTSCVREMLKDSRVKVNEPTHYGYTPLWNAAYFGHPDIVKWWIASGREMDLGKPGDYKDTIRVAEQGGKIEVAALLQRFKDNPVVTRYAMRVELGFLDELAAEMFALVVFVSDGLLQFNDTTTTTPAARFFSIARSLPLELQMVLCFRQVGLHKEIIPGKESELAFK